MFCKFLGVFWGRGLVALCERRELITSDVRAITQADARDSRSASATFFFTGVMPQASSARQDARDSRVFYMVSTAILMKNA